MFASLQLLLPNPQPQVVVPENAITYTCMATRSMSSAKKTRTAAWPDDKANRS
jgi:membrane fusion protein (multidrug efflux system)